MLLFLWCIFKLSEHTGLLLILRYLRAEDVGSYGSGSGSGGGGRGRGGGTGGNLTATSKKCHTWSRMSFYEKFEEEIPQARVEGS